MELTNNQLAMLIKALMIFDQDLPELNEYTGKEEIHIMNVTLIYWLSELTRPVIRRLTTDEKIICMWALHHYEDKLEEESYYLPSQSVYCRHLNSKTQHSVGIRSLLKRVPTI